MQRGDTGRAIEAKTKSFSRSEAAPLVQGTLRAPLSINVINKMNILFEYTMQQDIEEGARTGQGRGGGRGVPIHRRDVSAAQTAWR